MSEMDNNSGYLTPSDLEGEKAPDYGGKVRIGGQMYWVSGWRNTGKDGREYINLRFKKNTTYQAEKAQSKKRRYSEI